MTAWRTADSLGLRQFLDVALHGALPDHSTRRHSPSAFRSLAGSRDYSQVKLLNP